MDHFNATIKDGKLVRTRRGLQVSRQRFNGLSFVNSSPQDILSGKGPSSSEASSLQQNEIRFVDKGRELRKDAEHLCFSDPSSEGTGRRRKAVRKGKSPAASRAVASSQASPWRSEERVSQLENPQADPNPTSSATGTPASAAPELGPPLTDEEWVLFERLFGHTPRSMFPYEDILTYNPARGRDFYEMVKGDLAALHCVLLRGSIVEEVINSHTRSDCLAYNISKICAILNQKLDHGHAADAATLHSIATLAWVGCCVGRLDHWQLHMSGLKKVLDLNGGVAAGLPPWLLGEMYRADLEGAAALVSVPYLPFARRYDSVCTVLPPEVHEQTSHSISALLNPLLIHAEVITCLSSLANFASAIRLARQSGTVSFDPHAFTEEWQALTHALLTRPGPLRASECDLPAESPFLTESNDIAASLAGSPTYLDTQSYAAIHHAPFSTSALAPGPGTALDHALRIASLLYLKELLPGYPCRTSGQAVLLSLLRSHLAEIITLLQRQGWDTERRHPPTTATEGADNSSVDPLKFPTIEDQQQHQRQQQEKVEIQQKEREEQSHLPEASDAHTHTHTQSKLRRGQPQLKEVMAFLCLIGSLSLQAAEAGELGERNEHHGVSAASEASGTASTREEKKQEGERRYPRRAIYRECLREVLAGGAGLGLVNDREDEDALGALGRGRDGDDGEEEPEREQLGMGLGMVRLFHLGMVFPHNDEIAVLKGILDGRGMGC